MRCDFHCHTRYSQDSRIHPAEVVRRIANRGLEVVAITDHNTFSGVPEALAAAQEVNIIVIPGIEVRTEIGDIIGLFLTKEITSRDFKKTVEEVRGQNGVVMLPHPFKNHRITEEVMRQIDAVEIFNSRCSPKENRDAMDLASQFGKPGIFGSDAHMKREIGMGYCEIDASGDSDSIKAGVLKGATAIIETYSPPWNTLVSQMVKISRGGQIPSFAKIRKGFGIALKKMDL